MTSSTAALTTLYDAIPGTLSRLEFERLCFEAGSFDRGINVLEVGHYRGLSTMGLSGSLPPGSVLVTVDHHRGDGWTDPSDLAEFARTTVTHNKDTRVRLLPIFDDVFRALPRLQPPPWFDLIFYDGDRAVESCARFFREADPLMAARSVLCFAWANTPGGECLAELAGKAGFEDATGMAYRENYHLGVFRRDERPRGDVDDLGEVTR